MLPEYICKFTSYIYWFTFINYSTLLPISLFKFLTGDFCNITFSYVFLWLFVSYYYSANYIGFILLSLDINYVKGY